MTFLILLLVVVLVAWALHLMQEAVSRQEFSLMLAGGLVASASAALVSVYFVMGNYMGYVNQLDKTPAEMEQAYESVRQYLDDVQLDNARQIILSDSSSAPSLLK
jgi:uncharacterized protein YybS (DUF2232 family)